MNTTTLSFWAAALIALSAGCRGDAAASSTGGRSLGATPPPAASAAPPPAASADSPPATLSELLAREAASRPDGALRVEAVFGALRAGGMAVAGDKQVVGRTVAARYCALAGTPGNVAIAVCEYADAAAAAAGRDRSLALLHGQLRDRQIVINGATTLTVHPGDSADARAAIAIFSQM